MSYCRFGPDSDVYVIATIDGHHCVACRRMDERNGIHADFVASDRRQMYHHLIDHLRDGDIVPDKAFLRLVSEISDESLVDHYRGEIEAMLQRLMAPSIGFSCLIRYAHAHQEFMEALKELEDLNWPED